MPEKRDTSTVVLGELLRRDIVPSLDVAVAIVRELCDESSTDGVDAGRAPLDRVVLQFDGRVRRYRGPDESPESRFAELALTLRALLPDPGAPADSPSADLLRHVARSALLPQADRPFASVDQFCALLLPFAVANSRETVKKLLERVLSEADDRVLSAPTAETSIPPSDVPNDVTANEGGIARRAAADSVALVTAAAATIASEDTARPEAAVTSNAASALAAPLHEVELIDLRPDEPLPWDVPDASAQPSVTSEPVAHAIAAAVPESDEESARQDEPAAAIRLDPRPVTGEQVGDDISWRGFDHEPEEAEAGSDRPHVMKQAAAILTGMSVALVLTVIAFPHLNRNDGVRTETEHASTDVQTGLGTSVPLDAAPPEVRPAPPTARPPASPRSNTMAGAGQTASSDSRFEPPASRSTPAYGASSIPSKLLTAARLEPLDSGVEPTFSPSFAPDGALYFHAGSDGPSKIMRAGPTEAHSGPDVWRILDDGSRNYHPRVSPDGRHVAFDSDRDGTRGVYLLDLQRSVLWRASGDGYAAAPSWSPDGRSIAYIRAEPEKPKTWNLWLLDVASRRTRRLTSYSYGQPWSASWLPEGRAICYSHEDRLIVMDVGSGTARTYPSPKRGALVRTPAVSPDGSAVVFQVQGDGVWVLDFESGKSRRVLADRTAEEFAWSPDGSRVAFHSRRDGTWKIWVMRGREERR